MGIDPAPFWANLYIHFYESKYITKLIKSNDRQVRFRCFNSRIIFDSLKIAVIFTNSGNDATFLELDIQIIDNQFVYKLFDKRDAFPFSIVRMPDLSGNISSHVFYGSIFSEYLRIARATFKYQDFLPKAKELLNRMINQGAVENVLLKPINKLLDRHQDAFESFNVNSKTIKGDLRS